MIIEINLIIREGEEWLLATTCYCLEFSILKISLKLKIKCKKQHSTAYSLKPLYHLSWACYAPGFENTAH